MKTRKSLIFLALAVAVLALPGGTVFGADGGASGLAANTAAGGQTPALTQAFYANSPQPDPQDGLPAFNSGTPIRKFVTSLPGLTSANANEIGQFIPLAAKDPTFTFTGSDYYHIGLKQYPQRLHPDLAKATMLRGYYDLSPAAPANAGGSFNLGPMIVAQKNRPVRILFENKLSPGTAGNHLFPADSLIMGAGLGPDMMHYYSQNRAVVHLHGGYTPWISDGTPHQWVTPVGEPGPYFPKQTNPYYNWKGVSFQNVPDMVGAAKPITAPAANDGKATYYYTNEQSSRLMFYHEHAYGITRLGVYAGIVAPYLIVDPTVEDPLITAGTLPNQGAAANTAPYWYGIPLVIQDKTFIPNDIAVQDAAWGNNATFPTGTAPNWGQPGDLWFPHKYEPNQDPTINSGASLFGRWDYGPWFWPPVPTTTLAYPNPPNSPGTAHLMPGMTTFTNPWIYNASAVPEAFMDTMVVNGNPYPYLNVQPTAYRFRVLNGCNDRNINLSLFVADTGGAATSLVTTTTPFITNGLTIAGGATAAATVSGGVVTSLTLNPNSAKYTSAPSVYFYGGGGTGATAKVTLAPQTLAAANFTLISGGTGYTSTPTVTIAGGGLTGGTATTATATVSGGVVTGLNITPGTGTYNDAPMVTISGGGGTGAMAVAALTPQILNALNYTLISGGSGYTSAPTVQIGGAGEVKMVPAVPTAGFPDGWPTDGRDGGAPDPATRGPNIIQIGNEGGFTTAPALIPPTPVNYDYNRRSIVVLNVLQKGLFMGPAERADFIIDFSKFAGKTVILYNDAPAPVPGFDPRNDYYTGNPDQRTSGGAATTLPGYGPNTRTVMQFRVAATTPVPFNLATLQAAWPATYTSSGQASPIVPLGTYARIQDTSLTIPDPYNYFPNITAVNGLKTVPMQPKAIQELFDDYGRMNAILGVEVPFTNMLNQTTIPFSFIDPPSEGGDPKAFPGAVPIKNGDTQIWKITHNGVDTHTIHFHLVNVQVINRVGWDGMIRPPDANEIGWKESVRMHPLEDCIVAAQWKLPLGTNLKNPLPFTVPQSSRLLDVTMPKNTSAQFSGFDATGQPFVAKNQLTNFGWEYVWHCHLLGHEENDMMRPIVVNP